MIAAITLNVSIDRRYVVENAGVGKVNRVKECTCTAGGKGLNVARVVRALGASVTAGGIVGGDAGQYILHALDKENIEHSFSEAAGETRCCINISDARSGEQTEYLEPGMTVMPEEYARFLATYDALCGRCDVITLSGSLPRGLSSRTYAELIERARTFSKPVLLDTSGEALRQAIRARPYAIKPNEDEIAALAGCDIADDAALRRAAEAIGADGPDRVVVSLGARGAMLVCSEGAFIGRPPKLKAVNTVGCGDAMTAAFAVALERGMAAADSLRFAITVSAASALNAGTGGMDLADFQRVEKDVAVYAL